MERQDRRGQRGQLGDLAAMPRESMWCVNVSQCPSKHLLMLSHCLLSPQAPSRLCHEGIFPKCNTSSVLLNALAWFITGLSAGQSTSFMRSTCLCTLQAAVLIWWDTCYFKGVAHDAARGSPGKG